MLCACDAGVLIAIDATSGAVVGKVPLSGTPDVIFLHPQSKRLYVAIGDPGVIDVIDIGGMRRLEVVLTEAGAHTLALDRKRSKVYAFLPHSHRAAGLCRYGLMWSHFRTWVISWKRHITRRPSDWRAWRMVV